MLSKGTILVAMVAVALAGLTGCGGTETPPAETADAGAAGGEDRARLLPVQEGDAMPPDHPPVDAGQAGSRPTPPAGAGTGDKGILWTVPEGWVEETPSSSVRRAQYHVPGSAGDAECVVFYFGPGQGGDPMSNALRWASQFTQPDGRDSKDVLTTRDETAGSLSILRVEVTGNYENMMASPPERIEDAMLLGAIVQGPDANWFFKLTGPRDTVETSRPGFDALIGSMRTGG
jgi:hypothetical protein